MLSKPFQSKSFRFEYYCNYLNQNVFASNAIKYKIIKSFWSLKSANRMYLLFYGVYFLRESHKGLFLFRPLLSLNLSARLSHARSLWGSDKGLSLTYCQWILDSGEKGGERERRRNRENPDGERSLTRRRKEIKVNLEWEKGEWKEKEGEGEREIEREEERERDRER